MSVRTVKISQAIVSAAGVPQVGVTVTATLIPPSGAGLLLDTNNEVIDLTPLTVTSDATGTYTLDPAQGKGLIAPGDITPAGCVWTISYLATLIVSPSFAYTAATIAPSSWLPSVIMTGKIKMSLVDVLGNASPNAGASFVIRVSQDSYWTGGSGTGQHLNPLAALILSSDPNGAISAFLPPSAQLNPANTPYSLTSPSGLTQAFLVPATYTAVGAGTDRGAWLVGTTYALNDIVQVAGQPYISLQAGNVGNAPGSSPTFWALYAGEPISSHFTAAVPGNLFTLAAAGIQHDANVPALIDDPVPSPASLEDDVHNLASHRWQRRVATATGAVAAITDDVLLCDATTGAQTQTMPAVAARYRPYFFKKLDSSANAVTLARVGTDTFDGATTYALTAQGQAVMLVPNIASGIWEVAATAGAPVLAAQLPASAVINPMTAANDLIIGGTAGAPKRLAVGRLKQTLHQWAYGLTWENIQAMYADPVAADGQLLIRKTRNITSIAIGFIGDELTSTDPGGGNPPANCVAYLTYLNITATAVVRAVTGSTSAGWVSGSANLIAAKAAFVAAGVRYVQVMLGTNDAKTGTATTQAAYLANMTSMLLDLVTAGFVVQTNFLPYASAASVNTALLGQYHSVLEQLTNNATILIGDEQAYQYFQANSGAELAGDGISLTVQGATDLGTFWAVAGLRLMASMAGIQSQQGLGGNATNDVAAWNGSAWAARREPEPVVLSVTAGVPDFLCVGGDLVML